MTECLMKRKVIKKNSVCRVLNDSILYAMHKGDVVRTLDTSIMPFCILESNYKGDISGEECYNRIDVSAIFASHLKVLKEGEDK